MAGPGSLNLGPIMHNGITQVNTVMHKCLEDGASRPDDPADNAKLLKVKAGLVGLGIRVLFFVVANNPD